MFDCASYFVAVRSSRARHTFFVHRLTRVAEREKVVTFYRRLSSGRPIAVCWPEGRRCAFMEELLLTGQGCRMVSEGASDEETICQTLHEVYGDGVQVELRSAGPESIVVRN